MKNIERVAGKSFWRRPVQGIAGYRMGSAVRLRHGGRENQTGLLAFTVERLKRLDERGIQFRIRVGDDVLGRVASGAGR
jgi:hypothetical protein